MTFGRRPSSMGSSLVNDAMGRGQGRQSHDGFQGRTKTREVDVDRVMERIGGVADSGPETKTQSRQFGHHFSLAKGGLCSTSSGFEKQGGSTQHQHRRHDIGGAGDAQAIFEEVFPAARRSRETGALILEDLMRKRSLIGVGEQVENLQIKSRVKHVRDGSIGSRPEINVITADIVDPELGESKRTVHIKNNVNKYSLHFTY